MIERTVAGRHYRVIEKDGIFEPGDEVVALESDDVPYCVHNDQFNPTFEIADYDPDVIDAVTLDNLLEMEGNSHEVRN